MSPGAIVALRQAVTKRVNKDFGEYDSVEVAAAGSSAIVVRAFETGGSEFVEIELEDGTMVKCFAANVELPGVTAGLSVLGRTRMASTKCCYVR